MLYNNIMIIALIYYKNIMLAKRNVFQNNNYMLEVFAHDSTLLYVSSIQNKPKITYLNPY